MDAIAKTAYYCCGVRAADAASAHPVCGDTLAERFMTEEGRAVFAGFADLTIPNRCNAVRARIVDDLIADALAAGPTRLVILLGAGFDTRAFRLAGGRWVELDQPALMAAKEAVLPSAEAPNPLTRVPIDFARERLSDTLAAYRGEADALVVMEGVSMYLEQDALAATLATLRDLLPRHALVCDLMTASFSRRYGSEIRRRIAALGGGFAPLADEPAAAFLAAGYEQALRISIMARASALGVVPIPHFVLATLLRALRDGYTVNRFTART